MAQRICKFEDCGRPVRARDLCAAHYGQQRKGRELTPVPAKGTATRALARPGEPICTFEPCRRKATARGHCPTHYRALLQGRPLVPLDLTTEELFFQKVRDAGECWEWTGTVYNSLGYGVFRCSEFEGAAYRWAFEFLRHPIPDGLHIDHLCRNPSCVNPWHLEPVTQAVNTLRGYSPQAINARKTHCIRGHEFTPENTRREGKDGRHRRCRACDVIRDKARRARKVATTITPREIQ